MRYSSKTVLTLFAMALTALLTVAFTVAVVKADTYEIDKEGQVNQVIDGDTFNLKSGDKIGLADIDAPDSNDPGYQRATDYLTDLFNQYGWYVFLDVDNITGTDTRGRLICVAFVNYNVTHYLNVNRAMIESRNAYIDNYANNEFDPYTWQDLVSKSSVIPEFDELTVAAALMILTLSVLALSKSPATKSLIQTSNPIKERTKVQKSAMSIPPPPPPPPLPTPKPSSAPKFNRKTMIALVIIAIIVVAIVGVILATRGGGGGTGGNVAGANSLQFSTDFAFQGTSTTYTFSAKNIGTSSTLLRIEGTGDKGAFIYIINGAQKQAWVYENGAWTNLTAYYSSTWGQWNSTFTELKEELGNWSGFGDYTYTDQSSGYTIRIYSIAVNPSLADSLFEPS